MLPFYRITLTTLLTTAFQTEVHAFRFDITACTVVQEYQLSLTNPLDALHHGKRAANKRGRLV